MERLEWLGTALESTPSSHRNSRMRKAIPGDH